MTFFTAFASLFCPVQQNPGIFPRLSSLQSQRRAADIICVSNSEFCGPGFQNKRARPCSHSFRTPRIGNAPDRKRSFFMKTFRFKKPATAKGFTLVEIMIVVLIIGILLAIAIPNFIQARETSRAKACVANLKQIESAKQQYMMDKNASSFAAAVPTAAVLGQYIKSIPSCPSAGTYSTGTETLSASCSVGSSGTVTVGTVSYYHTIP